MDVRLAHPFSLVVAGPSGSGKSVFVEKLILSGLKNMDTNFEHVLWCYADWHPENPEIVRKTQFQRGFEGVEREDISRPLLIVIDDQMRESSCTSAVVDLFTKGCHHKNMSVIFITQNLFHAGKHFRDISLNAHYIVLLKNPRESHQMAYLARQICPTDSKCITEAYKDATRVPYGYLLLDLKQKTSEDCRCRTNMFGENGIPYEIVFKPKKTRV
jgi:hypothetical protein